MKCFLLLLTIVTFSPLTVSSVMAGTVFSWVDAKGVMHFTDKKPSEVDVNSEQLTTKIVEVTNILESDEVISQNSMPKMQTKVVQNTAIDETSNDDQQPFMESDSHQESNPDMSNQIDPEIVPEDSQPFFESAPDALEIEENKTPIAMLKLAEQN
tara:strand:+ start:7805 stop:8269 length:465 start_codon:yes stop_codon:yes gene_type:complete